MAAPITHVIAGDNGNDASSEPGPDARALFSGAVAHRADFDADVAWPPDPDAMMRAHYPTQTWPICGPLCATHADETRKPHVCAVVGGTDTTRALAARHVAEYMASFVGEPYSAVAAMIHPMDRETAVGRTLLAHAPPTCIYDDVNSWCACTHPPLGCRGRRLFLAYMSSHIARTSTERVLETAMNARHLQCDLVLIFGQGQSPQPRLCYQFDAVVLLPPLTVSLNYLVSGYVEQSLVRNLLAQGQPALFCGCDLTVAPFDLQPQSDVPAVPVQDQFHTHVAWRMHYALTRASSPQMRAVQATLRAQDVVPTLVQMSSRACLGRIDDVRDANVPVECLHAIAEAAALWLNLTDDSLATYEAMAALRRFMGHLARLCGIADMAQWPAVAIVRHLLDAIAQRASIFSL
ncbi:hypothetical protein pmac_cds_258 [Pandoravirus macleodensis]|uniref:Uncharacterized protein n=1 Tax=Pandoravirus macleodensis TaxID=2107707 RepID=A0A2U7UES7_9VIRU|nr:hypothetical protein pmac_cds_258 [Pandoravirus macleodensis]AVK76946.1 hypothetical protein pmac_cds_258 [Pandoravirus macleodensis]UMO79585.1 hypothetical protein [Pandoravirus aubagnensis]